MWKEYINAASLEEIIDLLAEKKEKARIVVGGTDLVLEMRQGLHEQVETLIDVSRVPGFDTISLDEEDQIHLGPTVTHNHCLASSLIRERALPLALSCWEVGAPQIKNSGTVAGNLITASPANDTIVPLMALDARLRLVSTRGERVVPLAEFYTGVRKTVIQPDEFMVEIIFPALADNQQGTYLKLGLRKAQAISLVNMSALLTLEDGRVSRAVVTLGAVAPRIIHAAEVEDFLAGKVLNEETIEEAAALARKAASPIDDIRGSAAYRTAMSEVLVRRGLTEISRGEHLDRLSEDPVLLRGRNGSQTREDLDSSSLVEGETPIQTTINGKKYTFHRGHEDTLLHLIRDQAGLIGSKVGCEEGECGACTVFLDGIAVMACLVPAPRAHQAEIITVEGLEDDQGLHPVQQAFIDQGAVQCGYCTPGFVMSAVKLLEEKANPSRTEIADAISGNLCRCTGYYKIIKAIEQASQKEGA